MVAGVAFLSGCGVLPQEEKTLSGGVAQQEEMSGAIVQTGDTTPIVVITEANSGAIVTQTGDSLIYRNEVYGFQVKLGKETKGVKIYAETPRAIRLYGTY